MQACAPLEMVSTVMMCKGGQGTMMDELSATWKKEGWKGDKYCDAAMAGKVIQK